ncbi:unnamed protein product [Schistosoma turkestanicum]|nr:unnamed protein product [Schistosoma turkestanicum]
MEAVRVRKPKLKTEEIIARLESIEVPDTPLLVDNEVPASPEPTVSEIRSSENGVNIVQSTSNSEEYSSAKDSISLYPSLDDHFTKNDPAGNQSADLKADQLVEVVRPNEIEASAPELLSKSLEERDFVYDNFPPALSSEHLKNLYLNRSLDLIDETEQKFLKGSDFQLLAVSDSSGFNIPDDPFYLLLCKYADNWGKWSQALKRLNKVLKESSEMEQSVWKVVKNTQSIDGKCQDKRTVYLKYEYETATLSQSALNELKETNEVSHWIIFEEIPLVAYKLVLCRNRIEEYLANILTQCSIYENLTSSQPGILIGSRVDSVHLVQLNEMRSTCSILFTCLRQFWSNQYTGRIHDPTFLKHLSNWLILTAGVTVRACRSEDHIFILMQLLRLPSQLIRLFACLLQPPDPTVAWERTKNLVEFLNQPEVELILTLFAICLRPVRERARFVTPANGASFEQQTSSSVNQDGTIWTMVDSAGESDTEEPGGIEVNKKSKNSTNKQCDIFIPLPDYNPNLESCTYLNPNDLNCLLGQLRIERVLQLLAYDYIPQCENMQDFPIQESGFMTSIAFADRVLSLIEACGKIYAEHVLPPSPQTHLGSWRSLAKRLAHLIRLLLITIGFRIQTIVYQKQYHSLQNSPQFTLILSQYDALCIRAVNCLLLAGSGLPDVYQKAGQFTCWRNLACTLPLGLTMIKTKKELFYIILMSILQNNHMDYQQINENSMNILIKESIMNNTDNLENSLPDMILNKLHHALLSMRFNELGLSVVINVLGKLASLECRPRIIHENHHMSTMGSMNTLYRYELPKDEASLIKCIMRIIFGLCVYHRPDDAISQKDNKLTIKHSISSIVTSTTSTPILSLLPISPKYGCKQLIEIATKHPQICLHLLYDLIIESALDLTTTNSLTIKLHEKIAQLNLCFGDQYMRVEDILLQLAMDAPFHIMQPTNKQLEFLINSLCHYTTDCFLHKLCRLFLSRFSWDAFKDLQSQEPFIPLNLHLDMTLGLCEIVDKHMSDLSHFHLSKLINPKLVSNIYKSAKSSVNVFTATLTDQFLSSLHISQQRLRIKSSGLNRLTYGASDLPRRTHSVENVTVSSSSSSNPDQNLSVMQDIIDWAAELLLRLIIPGSKYDQHYFTGTESCKLKEYINQIWFKLYALNQKNKCDQKKSSSSSLLNPITSFVMLSLQSVYTTFGNNNINNNDNYPMITATTTNDCLFWQPESSMLNQLLTSIYSYKHYKLTLRTFFESGLVQLISDNTDNRENNNDNNSYQQNELYSDQNFVLTDTTISWIFSQFSLVQGVYLIHLCPVNHPACLLIIHNVLYQLFNFINPSSIGDTDQHLSARYDQTNSTDYNFSSIKSRSNNNLFTPGFLLLRCLPASLFIPTGHSSYLPLSSSSPSSSSSSPSSSLNKQNYQQSLFQLIIQKIRLISSSNYADHSNKPSFTHDFNCLIEFLCQLDVFLSRSPYLNVSEIKSNPKFSHILDPEYQRSVIDILLCYFDWSSLNSFMQTSQSLWNTYQYMHKSNMKTANENNNVNLLSTVSPESSVLRLRNNESHQRRIELSRSSSFEVLFSSSSLMTLPSSIDQFPKYIKDTIDSLRQHAKQMCDRIECIEKLQNEFCTNILPKLYIPVRVKLLQYVECQSMLPSWMPGHQTCSGGSNISCEYQTDKRNEEIDDLYKVNRCDIDKLIQAALDVSRIAACDVLNYNDFSSSSTSTSSEDGKHSNFGVNWARTVLQLQNAVSYLIHKSRLVTSESKCPSTNATQIPTESLSAASSSSLNPSCAPTTTTTTTTITTTATNASNNNQLNIVQNIGLQCFQQLCQNLSGPLLQCPLTKQVLSNCVSELASEFLTNLSTQYQLLLDMLVALPHLSNLLASTFIPPNPSSSLLCMKNKHEHQQQQHPLVSIYQRLMDIRFRCNAQTALCILEKINFKAWFSIEIKHFNQEQWNQLILALFTCIQETTNVDTPEINTTCSEENDDLHKLCIVHLKALLTNHFPDLFVTALELLLQNLSNPKYLDIWILFEELLIADINNHSESSTSLSVEQLIQLLNHVHRRLTSTINSSPMTTLSMTLHDTQNVLIDECYSMLKNNSCKTIQMIIHFLMILACQLCEKIGCCILNNHLTIQNGQSIIMDMLVQVFGCILQKCITLYYNDKGNNLIRPSSTTSSSSSSASLHPSYELSSSSFILYVECCLKGFSECLNSAIKVCPTNMNPIWSNQLINLFLIWFNSTTCLLNNFNDNLKLSPITLTSTSTTTTTTPTTTTTTTANIRNQDLHKIPLPLIIYSSLINEKNKQANHDNNDEKKEKIAQTNEFILSKWCLSVTSCVWKPDLDCLDSMIMLLLNCDNFVNHQFIKELASNLLVHLLSNVQWWFDRTNSINNQSINVPEQRPWFISQSNGLQLKNSMVKMDIAYVNSLTYLIVLIASSLQTNDISKDTKIQLKMIMENIQSSLDLSIVSESCYLFILSYLTEQNLPTYYVLMPPTTMEGRLFGLLAAAGGMISKSADLFTCTPDSSFTIQSTSTGLYPNIHKLSSSSDHVIDYKLSNYSTMSLHMKRLAYLRKVISLLDYSLLYDNPLPLNEINELIMTDNFLNSLIKTHNPSSSSSAAAAAAAASSSSSTSGIIDSSIFSMVWNRMSSVMSNLTNNLNFHTNTTTVTSSTSTTTIITNDNSLFIQSQLNSSQLIKILTWLRICNLLSELESVSGQIGWKKSTLQEFRQIVELCNEIILLVNYSNSRMECLAKLKNFNNPNLRHDNSNKKNKQNNFIDTTISDCFIHAIIFWLLNDLAINTQINNNNHNNNNKDSAHLTNSPLNIDRIVTIMPHSIDARLSKPLIYSVLSMNSSIFNQEISSRFVQLLNATIWSVIDYAPNEMSSIDRFTGIYEIYSTIYIVQNKIDFLHSNLYTSMCIKNNFYLPLFFLILCRLNYFHQSKLINDEYNIIIADSMHWLHSIGINYMNGIDDRSFQLNEWILFLNLIIQLISTSKVNLLNNEPCCSNHPAWCSQHTNKQDILNNDNNCSADFHCKRLFEILNELKNNIMMRLKKKKRINISEEQFIQLKKLCSFIECLCCILETWMINTHPTGLLNLERLSCLTSSTTSVDSGKTEDITNMEEGNLQELKQDNFVTQDQSMDATNSSASIISSLLIRLQSFTLIEAYKYLCLQFWNDLKPYVKQILQNCSTTTQILSLKIP